MRVKSSTDLKQRLRLPLISKKFQRNLTQTSTWLIFLTSHNQLWPDTVVAIKSLMNYFSKPPINMIFHSIISYWTNTPSSDIGCSRLLFPILVIHNRRWNQLSPFRRIGHGISSSIERSQWAMIGILCLRCLTILCRQRSQREACLLSTQQVTRSAKQLCMSCGKEEAGS